MTADKELDQRMNLFGFQIYNIVILGVAAVGMVIITHLFPNFFSYPYYKWGGIDSVLKFWPAFAWAGGVTVLFALIRATPARPLLNLQIFLFSTLTSVLAGIWEELGYRYVFICYAMIAVVFSNWFFSAGLGWGLAVFLVLAAIAMLRDGEILLGLLSLVVGALSGWYGHNTDVIYWLYEHVLVNLIHYTTFTLMDPVLYNGHDKLFLFGAIAANIWFRNGHKYKGFFGLLNSWYIGLVLLYAAVTYGLLTAVVVHVLYDVLIALVRFTLRPAQR